MLPLGPLIIEHRLIERVIGFMKKHVASFHNKREVNPEFLETAVDFTRTYADSCHHGKEEDILLTELIKRNEKMCTRGSWKSWSRNTVGAENPWGNEWPQNGNTSWGKGTNERQSSIE